MGKGGKKGLKSIKSLLKQAIIVQKSNEIRKNRLKETQKGDKTLRKSGKKGLKNEKNQVKQEKSIKRVKIQQKYSGKIIKIGLKVASGANNCQESGLNKQTNGQKVKKRIKSGVNSGKNVADLSSEKGFKSVKNQFTLVLNHYWGGHIVWGLKENINAIC